MLIRDCVAAAGIIAPMTMTCQRFSGFLIRVYRASSLRLSEEIADRVRCCCSSRRWYSRVVDLADSSQKRAFSERFASFARLIKDIFDRFFRFFLFTLLSSARSIASHVILRARYFLWIIFRMLSFACMRNIYGTPRVTHACMHIYADIIWNAKLGTRSFQ